MKIDIITIFPAMFDLFLENSIIKNAIIKKKINFNIVDLRDYSHNKHRKIDDTPYGGGAGMLLAFPPLYDAIADLSKDKGHVIYLSPQGQKLTQSSAKKMANFEHLVLICGHYEGIDERVLEYVDEEISIGDYILTGGELGAMVLSDAVIRLIPGVISAESVNGDSLANGLLKHPEYTKPEEYKGQRVPDVLLSGHHLNIFKWRKYQSLKQTFLKRPDLLKSANLDQNDLEDVQKIASEIKGK